jgi:hypothetical protein
MLRRVVANGTLKRVPPLDALVWSAFRPVVLRRLSTNVPPQNKKTFNEKLAAFREKSKVIIWKALTEPTPTIAGIQQVRGLACLLFA